MFNQRQLSYLNEKFNENNYQTDRQIKNIAKELKMKENQIKVNK